MHPSSPIYCIRTKKISLPGGRFAASAYNLLILLLLRFASIMGNLIFAGIEYTISAIEYTIFSLEYTIDRIKFNIFSPNNTIAIIIDTIFRAEYTIFPGKFTNFLGKFTYFLEKFIYFLEKFILSVLMYNHSSVKFTSVIITSIIRLSKKPYFAGKFMFPAK